MKRLLFTVLIVLTSVATPSLLKAADRRIIFINNSSFNICKFHASNTNRTKWEEDILGTKMVRPGQRISINIDDGTGSCWFDFKTVTCTGTSVVRQSINVCKITTYTINDD